MFSDGAKPPAGESDTETRGWLEWEVTRRYTLTLRRAAAPLKIGGRVESERAEGTATERAAVARGQNVLYVLPQDAAAVAQFLDPVLARIAPDAQTAQVLVLTPDDETAVLIAEAATRTSAGAPARVLPVTASRRAARLMKTRPPTVIAGSPIELLALLNASLLKLEDVKHVIIAWADAMADGSPTATALTEALAAVVAEVPKEAARTLVTSQLTPAVEALVERYAWRARRAGVLPAADGTPIDLAYIAVAPRARARAFRRLLDDLDPERAAVYARSDDAEREVRAHAPRARHHRGRPERHGHARRCGAGRHAWSCSTSRRSSARPWPRSAAPAPSSWRSPRRSTSRRSAR